MVVTNDSSLAETVKKLRTHGWREKYHPEILGYNSRLDELHAATLLVKLRYLDRWNERRREIAAKYRRLLADGEIELPWEAPYAEHVYHLYILRVKSRSSVQGYLRSQGVATGVYYPLPLHQVGPYQHLGDHSRTLPEAERAARETLAIPLYPEMTDDQIEAVALGIIKAATPTGVRR